jgi:hypothetical protein
MEGRDYEYTSFHHQGNWNAEHCKGGRIKWGILDKDGGYDEMCWLIATKGSTQHQPASQC